MMDNVFVELAKFGIAGIMTGVVVLFAWFLLKKSMEQRESDLSWYQKQLDSKRLEFTAALAAQQGVFLTALDKNDERCEKTNHAICDRLERIEGHIMAGNEFWRRTKDTNEALIKAVEERRQREGAGGGGKP